MTRGGRRERPEPDRRLRRHGADARRHGNRHGNVHMCTFGRRDRCYPRRMLDPKQRHKLLTADRTKDVSWVRAAIEHLMAADPDVSLDEIEDVLRAGAGTAYLVGTAEGFEVAIGFAASRRVLAEAGMTAEQNRLALAGGPNGAG